MINNIFIVFYLVLDNFLAVDDVEALLGSREPLT
jgi:hypothetical protein